MQPTKKSKNRFKLSRKQGSDFKGKSESLKIRKVSIDKLKEKEPFSTTGLKKKSGNMFENKAQIEFNRNKKRKKKQKESDLKNVGSQDKQSIFSASKLLSGKMIDKSVDMMTQDEDLEELDSLKRGNHAYRTAKQSKRFLTKNEQISKKMTSGKIADIRFSRNKSASSAMSGRTLKQPNKTSIFYQKSLKTAKEGLKKVGSVIVTKTPLGWIALGFMFLMFLFMGILFLAGSQSNANSDNGSVYVKHWDGKDAYHSNLLAQRYGIKAEQIDSFIKQQGYAQVDSRATGKEFLRLQSISGIDVRMLVAFAQMESSYGTAGVAKQFPKANIFGYGAFDNDPNQGASWDNTRAVNEFRKTQIDSFGNRTIAIMDERARAYHNNMLKPGQYVYWTQLDAGKPRAAIAEKLDKWIDDHGGTPDPPGGYGSVGSGGAGLAVLDKKLGQVISGEFGGVTGQCYAVSAYYAHSITPDIILRGGVAASNIGNDYNWSKWNWKVIKWPSYKDIRAGDIINFKNGANMGSWYTDPNYGHTGVVGKVLGNNQFILYDQNPGPLKTWKVTFISGDVASVIRPPK